MALPLDCACRCALEPSRNLLQLCQTLVHAAPRARPARRAARLAAAHGDRFEAIKAKTSVVPFAAILDGRQELPADYWKEFARAPYALIAAGTLGAYAAHPYMQAGAALVKNTGLVPGGVLDSVLG